MLFGCRIILVISISSLSLYSMDSSQQKHLIKQPNLYKINDLYKKLDNTLKNYNPDDVESVTNVLEIIKRTKKLTREHETELKIFAYNQYEEDTINIIKDSFLPAQKPPYHNPFYICVCLARISEYNTKLKNDNLESPTIEQFAAYRKKQATFKAILEAQKFHLPIVLTDVQKNTDLIPNFPKNIALYDFQDLMTDMSKIQQTDPNNIKILAYIKHASYINKSELNALEQL